MKGPIKTQHKITPTIKNSLFYVYHFHEMTLKRNMNIHFCLTWKLFPVKEKSFTFKDEAYLNTPITMNYWSYYHTHRKIGQNFKVKVNKNEQFAESTSNHQVTVAYFTEHWKITASPKRAWRFVFKHYNINSYFFLERKRVKDRGRGSFGKRISLIIALIRWHEVMAH